MPSWLSLRRSVTRLVRAYRDENGFHDNIAGGLATGALAGYLFRDLKKLQIEKSFQRGRFLGGPLSVLGGAAVGCVIGVAVGAADTFNRTDSNGKSMRYWQTFWKAHEEEVCVWPINASQQLLGMEIIFPFLSLYRSGEKTQIISQTIRRKLKFIKPFVWANNFVLSQMNKLNFIIYTRLSLSLDSIEFNQLIALWG